MSEAARSVVDYLVQSRDIIAAAIADPEFVATIAAIVDRVAESLTAGHKLLLAGNGGSAVDAQHLAGEFLSRFNYDRAPVAAIVQQLHITAGHIICGLVETRLFPRAALPQAAE
jgi:phosphoheptose isomerase